MGSEFRVNGLEFWVGLPVWSFGCRVTGLEFWVKGLGSFYHVSDGRQMFCCRAYALAAHSSASKDATDLEFVFTMV